MNYRLGASLNKISTPLSEEIIDLLSSSCISTFEASHQIFDAPDSEHLKEALKLMCLRSGKEIVSYHMPYGPEYDISSPDGELRSGAVDKIRLLLEEAAFFGAGIIVVHSSYEPVADHERALRIRNAHDSICSLEDSLKARSMRLALELLPRTCIGRNVDEILAILDGTEDCLGACLDVNHFMADFNGICNAVDRLGKKLFTLHISDYDGIDERHRLPGAPGSVIDWKEILLTLRTSGYSGPFNYECSQPGISSGDNIRNIEENFRNYIQPLLSIPL